MKILILLTVLGIYNVDAFMDIKQFNQTILHNCFGRLDPTTRRELPHGQELPIPNTIEAFIGLVEKLEFLHPQWRAADIVKLLLLNFRYDDIIGNTDHVSTRGDMGTVGKYYEMLISLFSKPTSSLQLRQDDLTHDERCALYFMISRSVNDTYREGEESIMIEDRQVAKHRREFGIVTMTSQSKHAFALGKVLLGLLAGLERTEPASANRVYKDMKNGQEPPENLGNVLINVLYAATFGDIVSVTKVGLKETTVYPIESLFYQNGRWEGAVCPVDYLLEEDSFAYHHGTFSLIRGAIDGYRLGSNIKDLLKTNTNWKLSQVMRMYYSGSGFPGNVALSYCNRIVLKMDELRQDAITFDKVYSAVKDDLVSDEKIAQSVDRILNMISGSESRIISEINEENDLCNTINAGMRCETPVDLIAILDWRSVDQREMQSIVVGNLSSGMTFGGPYGGSSSVYTNLKPYGGGYDLDTIINGSHISGYAGCAATYYNPIRASYSNEIEVFQYLNYTLGKYDDSDILDDEQYGVPAKAIVYFNYQNPADEYRLRQALNEIRWRYRGARIFAIGSREDNLKIFTDDSSIVANMNFEKLRQLKQKVCKVPAQFQYKKCYKRDAAMEKNERYEGFVTPRHSQYWMMDPKYFLKSFTIKLTFKALTGEIRVCYSRDYNKIFDGREPNGAECGISSSTGNEVTFTVSNPCHRYTESSCSPFYFYIEGRTAPKDNEFCKDEKCKTMDQISYEFTHEGISCNKGILHYAVNPLVMLLATLLFRTLL